MKSRLPETVRTLPLGWLDVGDRTFATSPAWEQPDRLIESVRRGGLLSPLRVQSRGDDRFRIVSGFRRVMAARAVGLESVPCLVLDAADGPASELFLGALLENLGTRELGDVERAVALTKLRDQFGFLETEIVERFLPWFGVRPDRRQLQHSLQIAKLPVEVQRAMPELISEVALRLGGWSLAERRFFLDLLDRYRLGRNRQREAFELLDELKALGTSQSPVADVLQIWSESGCAEIDADPATPPTERLVKWLEALRERRFPILSRQETRARELKRRLHLPPEIQLNPPRFLEGDRVSIQFQARSPADLKRLTAKLDEISDSQELKALFELL